MTKIIAGTAGTLLADSLRHHLGLSKIEVSTERYQDQELRVKLNEAAYGEDVIIVQSTSMPANDHLMELLLLIDAAKRSGANKVIACVPYFGYSRQDRPSYSFGPISARLIASMLETAGIDHLVTLDLHSLQIEGFFKVSVQNLDTIELFAEQYKNRPNLMVVSPDIGGTIRARKLSGLLGSELTVINKIRNTYNTCEMNSIIGNVKGFDCLIIDDIIDTGETLCKAACRLLKNGANSVEVVASHAVLSGDAIENLEAAPIKTITVTNSIEQKTLAKKFNVVDIASTITPSLKKFLEIL